MSNAPKHCRSFLRNRMLLAMLAACLSLVVWPASADTDTMQSGERHQTQVITRVETTSAEPSLPGERVAPPELLEVNVITTSRPAPASALDKELDTMSRVIEKSLDQSGVGDWHSVPTGLSSFDRVIRAQYIPTVGAIFTVSVNFPIVAPSEGKPKQAEPGEPGDLWDELSAEPSPRIPEVESRKHLQTRRETFVGRGDRLLVFDDTPYDKGRVEHLRSTLVSVLLKYGRRLEHVQPSERILIVVEAPQPQHASVEAGAFLGLFEEAQGMARVFGMSAPSPLTNRDHLLFSVVKAGLTSDSPPEASKVNVLSY